MKINIKILALLISAVILQSCKDKKEEIILDFLNKTENKFDKNKFEFVDLKFIDTIYNSDIYENPNFLETLSINSNNSEYYIDTVAVDSIISIDGYQNSPIIPKQIDWRISPFSEQFYNYINYAGDESYYTEGDEDSPNILLNGIVKSNYVDFKNKLLTDITFQNKLKNEISKYEYFKGVFSADSLIKLIGEEKIKRKILYGYLYELTFRSNSILNKRRIIFNPNMETIIGSKQIKN